MAIYEQELASFKQQWNLPTYDLQQVASSVHALRFADSFLTGASVDNSNAGQFVKWFSRTLSIYFATNTTPNEDGKYMSSFDAQAFYDSFKSLVQAKYDADAEEKGTEPLQVSEVVTDDLKKTIQNTIANGKRNYKKTLPTLWQENLKDGSLKLETLKAITDYSTISRHEQKQEGKLTNLLAAREAMKQLRASRSGVWGWLWKVIFNRAQNRQEKEYLQELNDKIGALKDTYDIDAKVAELTGKTVLGKAVTEEKAKEQEQPAKKPSKPAKIKPCAEKIESMYYDNDLEVKIAGELLTKIPVKKDFEEYKRRVFEQTVVTSAFDAINVLNQQFDQDIKNGNQREAMAKLVRGVFKATHEHVSLSVSGSDINKVAGCVILAQAFINNLTAVSIYPELSDLANEYIKNNTAIYKEIEKEDYFYENEIDNYAVDYVPEGNYTLEDLMKEDQPQNEGINNVDDGISEYEPAFDDDNPFVEDSGEIVPQVSQAPKQNVPTFNNNK